jgi:hypothetical protein
VLFYRHNDGSARAAQEEKPLLQLSMALTNEWQTGFSRSNQQNMRLCQFLILKK